MEHFDLNWLPLIIFIIAVLYSSIGHGGASGYIAAMAIFGVMPTVLKPTALTLNLFVSCVATICFFRAGHFSWRLFWPFAVASIPASFIGGYISLPIHVYKIMLGLVLFASAYRLLTNAKNEIGHVKMPSIPVSLCFGTIIGLLSGLTGVGGGIFLSPLLVLMGWSRAKEASAISATFILVNSTAGLLGYAQNHGTLPVISPAMVVFAVVGGVLGAYLGCYRMPRAAIVRTLSAVLFAAGSKMLLI